MPNLVMVMPYQAYIRRAQAEGFRIHAIWDPAEADRLFGTQAAQYLRDVEILADGFRLVDFTDRGRQRAADIIRRHRLAERLFTETLKIQNEAEIEQQACKFEHILSPEATDKICTFLGHPRTCPHGAPIPRGVCCGGKDLDQIVETVRMELPRSR